MSIKHGDKIYDKLDGRPMIVVELIDAGAGIIYRCRYFNAQSGGYEFIHLHKHEFTKSKKGFMGFKNKK